MRIGQSFAPTGAGARRGTGRVAGDDGFAGRLVGRPAGQTAVAGLTPLTSLGAVLAAQEIDDPAAGRRRSRERGRQLLDGLDELRLALLDGRLAPHQLQALQALAREQRSRSADRALEATLDEIELRVAVELAKLPSAAG